jgi:hypothetical protein
MKKFYVIKGGVACKKTNNIYPQVLKPLAPKGSEHYQKITNLRNKPNPDSKGLIIELELDHKTNPTDFISQSWIGSIGILVSQSVFEFLSGFNLQPDMETYKTIIHHKGKTSDYVWLNPIYRYEYDIDFEKTKFSIFDILDETYTPIEISSIEDFKEKNLNQTSPLKKLHTSNVYLTTKQVDNLDLIQISAGDANIYISENLKNQLGIKKFSAFEVYNEIEIK